MYKSHYRAVDEKSCGFHIYSFSPFYLKHFNSTLAIFIKMVNKPSLRALAKQSRSDFQLKIGLDCFTSFAKTTLFCRFLKMANVEFKLNLDCNFALSILVAQIPISSEYFYQKNIQILQELFDHLLSDLDHETTH